MANKIIPSPEQKPKAREITVVVGAIATSDYGDSPNYAAFRVTQDYIDRLRRAADVAQEHGFTEVRKPDGPDWGLDEDELRLEYPEISIKPGGSAGAYFLFIDRPRHADYDIESRAIDLKDLQKVHVRHRHAKTSPPGL